jgi:AcrR family transcriptional regulator
VKQKIDRRAARTRRALHDALIALILRKRYDAVTVQDIIDEADVGRATFYAHYTGKEDLLRGGFAELRAELTASHDGRFAKDAKAAHDPLAFSLAVFEHVDRYRQVYRALVGGRGGAIALNELRNVLSHVVKQQLSSIRDNGVVPPELTLQFVVGAFITVLTWWIERRPKLRPSEADVLLRSLLMTGIGPSIGR